MYSQFQRQAGSQSGASAEKGHNPPPKNDGQKNYVASQEMSDQASRMADYLYFYGELPRYVYSVTGEAVAT